MKRNYLVLRFVLLPLEYRHVKTVQMIQNGSLRLTWLTHLQLKLKKTILSHLKTVSRLTQYYTQKLSRNLKKLLRNPLARLSGQAKEQRVDQGKKLWNMFCHQCHGRDGKGVGTITDVFVPAPDITDMYKSRKDGFFFHKITFGGAIMPSLGHSISAHERWKIVLYIRQLQNGGQK